MAFINTANLESCSDRSVDRMTKVENSKTTLGPRVPHERLVEHYTNALKNLFDALQELGILALEWGQGLSRRMGDTTVFTYHTYVIPLDHFDRAQQLAAKHLGDAVDRPLPRDPLPSEFGRRSWYEIPDRPSGFYRGLTPLVLCSSNLIPLSIESVSFDAVNRVWYPNEIQAFKSFIGAYCLWNQPSEQKARSQACSYLTAFLLYYLLVIDDMPTFSSKKEEDEFDDVHEAIGLRRLALLPWTEETLWIRRLMERMVKGEFKFDQLTSDYWRQNTSQEESGTT